VQLRPLGPGKDHAGLCPFHDDTTPSFHINPTTGQWFCHAEKIGGDGFDFWGRLKGISGQENFPKIVSGIAERFEIGNGHKAAHKAAQHVKKRVVAVYPYLDEQGNLLFEHCRTDPKSFFFRRPDGNGGHVYDLADTRRVLYRLPELLAAGPDVPVLMAEGEKAAEALAGLGLVATCAPGGAGSWPKLSREHDIGAPLRNRRIFILPDNDPPGHKHALDVARDLKGKAAAVYILNLPGLAEKADPFDFIEQHGQVEAARMILDLMAAAMPWEPPAEPPEAEPEAGPEQGGPWNLTDLGNAERLVHHHGRDLRFCFPQNRFFVWTGQRWAEDDQGEVMRRAKATVQTIYGEARHVADDDRRAAIGRHAYRSENETRLRAMVNLARMDLAVLPGGFDRDPWLLNVANGTLDLRTGRLLPHRREDMMTRQSPVRCDPDAVCPRWTAFLDEVMAGNQDMIRFLQRAVGYSLTGAVAEQCFFLLHGCGSNGKTVFLETVRAMLADYALQADFSTFLAKRNDPGTSNDLAALAGVRLVSASESGAGRSLNEPLIKALTGGEPVRARFLYSEFFEFHPVFKLWLATNHRPAIRDASLSIWRRVRLIPFEVVIPKERQDRGLLDKMKAELSGILNWAVAGCTAWQKDGLQEPDEVRAATESYRADQDIIGGFIEDRAELDPSATETTKALRMAYEGWCQDNGQDPVSPRTFATLLIAKGCQSGRTHQGRVWLGIRLRA